jgi:hypothetical protein
MPLPAEAGKIAGLSNEELTRALIGPAAVVAVGIIGGVYICLSHAYERLSTPVNDAEIPLSDAATYAPVPTLPLSEGEFSHQTTTATTGRV